MHTVPRLAAAAGLKNKVPACMVPWAEETHRSAGHANEKTSISKPDCFPARLQAVSINVTFLGNKEDFQI